MLRFDKAVLLYNPVSGGGSMTERAATVRNIERILRQDCASLTSEPTTSAGSATEQARKAIANGCDLVIACGGDGTIFEVLQSVAATNTTLAVIPFGTGNVLANDLNIPSDPIAAANALLKYQPRRISLGHIQHATSARYFTVAAGVGVHAELIYNSGTAAKKRGGIAAYYLSGFKLLFAHEFLPFTVEITSPEGHVTREEVLELISMRVSSFGRWLKRWRPGSSLTSTHMQLVILKQSSRFAMVRYVFGALLGNAHRADATSRSADVRFIPAIHVRCFHQHPKDAERIRLQADGESLGEMPVELKMIPDALTLLMPPA